jgi:hypothetical protein
MKDILVQLKILGIQGYNDNLPRVAATNSQLKTILNIVIGIIAALSVLFIVIGGMRYVLSAGDPQAAGKAKNTIIYDMIGIKSSLFRIVGTLLIMVLSLAAINAPAYAAVDIIPGCDSGSALYSRGAAVCTDVNAQKASGTNPVVNVIKIAIIFISYVTGIAAVILIVISGIRFMTAGGDSNKVGEARGTLLYAVIGIFITMIAQGLVAFVLDKIS